MSTVSPLSRLQELLPKLFQSTQLAGNPYLRFELVPEVSGSISMEQVRESLLVPAENITPLPNMPAPVMGLMSSRERVFCAIDLAELVGLSSLSAYSREYHVIVVPVSQSLAPRGSAGRQLLLGLAVNRVQGIIRVMPDDIRPSPREDFPSSLAPYLEGWAMAGERELFILNIDNLVSKTLLSSWRNDN